MRTKRQILLATLVASVVGLSACGDSDPQTFEQEGFPFTFEYPDDFETSDDVTIDQELGAAPDETVGIGLDDSNALLLQRFTLQLEVDEDNIDQAKAEFDRILGQIDPGASGETGEIAGFPSLSYEPVAVPGLEGGESRFTVLFDGDQEYLINCQSIADEREAIDAACEQALETLART